ncbi:MAG: RraA family protein [Candidatus Thorarchaeota archaeon]|nr:RraA family protein [Candidatus Thorarchaeota archaeon]
MTNKKTDLLNRVLKLYVAAVSDAADELDLSPVCMNADIRPITKNTRMAGFARTGKLLRAPVQRSYDEEQLHDFMSLATKAEEGDIVAITSSGATDCSVWGQVLTRIGKPRGLRGAVVDGTSRDIHDINRMDFPVFARGRHPATMRGRLDMESVGEPIVCGGVRVTPGDLIFGDGDGVVVIPQDRVEEVITAAEEVVGTDTWWAGKLEDGENPHDLHEEKPIP